MLLVDSLWTLKICRIIWLLENYENGISIVNLINCDQSISCIFSDIRVLIHSITRNLDH